MKEKIFKIFLLDNDQNTSPKVIEILEQAGSGLFSVQSLKSTLKKSSLTYL